MFLSPVEAAAVDLLTKPRSDLFSDALRIYLEAHHKGDSKSVRKSSTIAADGLVAVIGDKPVERITRADARAYINAELARGVSTGTVRRRLTSLNAIFNGYLREKELDRPSPFSAHRIAKEGEDEKKRQPFTPNELESLKAKCREADDDMRWLLALLSDTGARLAEVTGLALDDLRIDAEIPHVVIRPHPWRSLKNRESERSIPLVGASLWAAQRVKARAKEGQRYAFPRYIKNGACNATSASNALSSWIRKARMDHTPHGSPLIVTTRIWLDLAPDAGWKLKSWTELLLLLLVVVVVFMAP